MCGMFDLNKAYHELVYGLCREANILDKLTDEQRHEAAIKRLAFLWEAAEDLNELCRARRS